MSLKRIVKKKSNNKLVEAPIVPMVTPNPGQMPPIGPENPEAVPPEGQPVEPEQQGIPLGEMGGYFEIMRQNYFEVKRCIWITGAIDWSIAIRTIQRLSFYDDDSALLCGTYNEYLDAYIFTAELDTQPGEDGAYTLIRLYTDNGELFEPVAGAVILTSEERADEFAAYIGKYDHVELGWTEAGGK